MVRSKTWQAVGHPVDLEDTYSSIARIIYEEALPTAHEVLSCSVNRLSHACIIEKAIS
jgi:hypothetical protein